MLKVLIWGTGGTWKHIKEYLDYDEIDIVGFVDNAPSCLEINICGKNFQVLSPHEYLKKEKTIDKIFIASMYFIEIQEQLIKEFGIEKEKIEIYKFPSKIIKESYFVEIEKMKRQEDLRNKIISEMHLQAKILNYININKENILSINEIEYKVYSQWGEDGIIQYLIHKLPIKNKTFIEFGVEDYQESNTRFLLEENNWSGMVIDASHKNIESIKKEELYWKYDLKAFESFVTKDNINELLNLSEFDEDLGLLSIDIDGNDYWILKEIDAMKPRILICEYNAIYGEKDAVTISYKEDFYRTKEHYSNLYFGASLEAIKQLAKEKGYCFIGTNYNACNAFFVREELASYLPKNIINSSEFPIYKYRQARDKNGKLLYLSRKEEVALIAEQKVYDVREKKIKKISELNL